MLVYYQFNTCSALYHHLLSVAHILSVDFIYFIFTCMPCGSYHTQVRALVQYSLLRTCCLLSSKSVFSPEKMNSPFEKFMKPFNNIQMIQL